MRIYLDNCVFQDLKKEEYAALLELVKADKERNIYCFSEAHLYDLSRDKTDQKFDDMVFMEEISGSHCFYFNEKTRFEYHTPTQYYDSFDWSHVISFDDLFSDEDGFMGIFQMLLKAIPLDFKLLIEPDQFPADMPEDFKTLLVKPSNAYEFFQAFIEFTGDLTKEQKRFKEFVKYLHKNSLIDKIYEGLRIEGYSGGKVFDKGKFRNSYANYFIKEGQKKSKYELFLDMYNGLEFFGFVKGKPKKQRMMNLINDGRHAFFGAHCDIVVSSDEDFIRKTRFLYEIYEVGTFVISINELETIVTSLRSQSEMKFSDLIKEANEDGISKRIMRVNEDEKDKTIFCFLRRTYFTYFDMVAFVITPDGTYQYFTKEPNNFSTGTMVKELEVVTRHLISEFGKDLNNNEFFSCAEIKDGKWIGRTWVIGETLIELNYLEKIHLALYPFDYMQTLEKAKQPP